jgi:hypothetical protein
MRHGIQALAVLLFFAVVTGTAIQGQAETLNMTGTMTLRIGELQGISVPSNGTVLVSAGGGGFVEPAGAFGPLTMALPKSMFTGVPQISGLTLTGFGNGTMVFDGPNGTAVGGLAGNTVVTVLQSLNLTIPLEVVGVPGATAKTNYGSLVVTVIGQGWTADTAFVTGLSSTTPGTNVVNTVTLAGSNHLSEGRLTLVSGFQVITNVFGALPGFAVQMLTFPDLLPDSDDDGDPDLFDNCPDTPNANQADT